MKKSILFIIGLLLCLNLSADAQSWRKAFNSPISSIGGGCVVDQNVAYVVGSSKSIYKSTDGGYTWINKYHADTSIYSALDVCFVNTTTGFVGCSYGNILKTTDGGETWKKFLVPDTTYQVTRLYFFNENLGYALCTSGKNSYIYKTTNGCSSWTTTATITGSYMYNMDFSNQTRGIATGTGVSMYYTNDGNTWQLGSVSGWPTDVTYSRTDQWGVKFISATSAISCGWGSTAVGYEPTIFLRTTNAGATWFYQNQALPNRTYVNFKSLWFKDSLTGFGIGGSTYPGTVISKTTDGGANWVPLPTVSGFNPQLVMGYNNKIIVAGDGGNIILSDDFGNSWSIINDHPSSTLSSVNTINNNIYACGYGGVFFKSTDLGNNFKVSYMVAANKCLWSKAIQFLNENVGFACSQKRQVLKTTNAGLSWTQILQDTNVTTYNLAGLYFFDEKVGFAAGNLSSGVDVIFKTTDGGQSWSSVQNLAFQTLNCISFADDKHGAAGGNKSAMLYTTDQGVTWKNAAVNTADQLTISAIKFYNGLNGIAVGSSLVLKTSDGGATWNRITIPGNYSLSAVCYSGSIFYAVGGKYCLKSTDEGNTWVNIMDTLFAVQNSATNASSVALDNAGNVWITTTSGMVTNSPATGIINESIEPNTFSLEQNYPNPFNPSTNITFTLNERTFVILRVFDILGREVRVLYKGEMTAGKHLVNFNAGNLASGTYIYSLQAKDKFTNRKMTLLK
jgi:photosystem II stability/assembly factor-like uncharacterized protein